eukprot:CAMPEP_0184692676 /NCGR_PEP_ID=MMETSP0313-20130426/1056_1 /TAXON_ID=2792 /ORGANISM="Porphyridium aerugineum, Strain SAG 1380-2" /LENGTH=377 /DNA_ID=CAMNT_0027150525 /DNA_START=87 /DNA_END=1220 /DNA_ORIENTATION=+
MAFVSGYGAALSTFVASNKICISSSKRAPVAASRKQAPVITMQQSTMSDSKKPMYSADAPDVLQEILARKVVEVETLKAEMAKDPEHPVAKYLANKGKHPRSKAFINALRKKKGHLSVIAEIKRKSPSKGKIGDIKSPATLSRLYQESGAACISVLTDFEGFGGTLKDMREVVEEQARHLGDFPGPCPVIRKDFTIDEVQIAEAAVNGASAILLIVSALKERTAELLKATHELGLDALVEVHDEEELQIALDSGAELIGVNNRNLRTFEVSLETSARLRKLMPDDKVLVAESGIRDALDAWTLRDMGFNAILVGETLVQAAEISTTDRRGYVGSFNQAKGLIKAFISKGSTQFASPSEAAFYGAGEGARESLGELEM